MTERLTARRVLVAAALSMALCELGRAEWRAPPPGLPGNFTIGLHAAPAIEADDYKLAAEAGFNLAVPVRPGAEYSSQLLKACKAAGIKAVVWDPRIATHDLGGWEVYGQVFREFRKVDAVAGYVIANYLPVPPARTHALSFRIHSAGHADDARFRYLEACHLKDLPGENSYERYLRRYLTAGLGYALYEEDDPFSVEAIKAMQVVGRVCGAQGMAWWRRCRLDDSSPPMIRWQAYSAAAAGAKGIIYLIARPVEGFRHDSLLDAQGKPTLACEAARATNRRLAALGPTLMKVRSARFYTTGNIPGSPAQRPADSPIASITSSDGYDGFLVGLLEAEAARYAFVVRKVSEAPDSAEVTVTCAGHERAIVVETGQPLDGPLRLLPGEGQLLRVQ